MSVVDEIKQKLDIVDIVSQHVRLMKSGQNFKGLCPFHAEKDASFYVYPQQQSWHCFGSCGTGGDIFTFIMKKEGVDFAEALRRLSETAGIALETRRQGEEEDKETDKLREVNAAAALYFHHLLVNAPEAAAARAYLGKRGATKEGIEDFQLGFSPDSWDSVIRYLADKGFSEAEITQAGLAIEKDGRRYDRFRSRLMFPIRDARGRAIGFGGRALDDAIPKYLNSPQSPVFAKGEVLYGLDRAAASIRKENMAIIVEGYMDVLAAHQHGFKNVIASMGTSLSEKQLDALKRLSKRLALALDSDAAGNAATIRGIEVATQALDRKVVPVPTWQGLVRYNYSLDADIRIITLPPGKDPDEVINESEATWTALVDGATPVVDYLMGAIASALDMGDPRDKSAAVDRLLPILAEIQDPVQQAHYLQKLARIVRVDERVLQETRSRKQAAGRRKRDPSPLPLPSPLVAARSQPIEEYCLALLLRHSELAAKASELTEGHFDHPANREVFCAWRQSLSVEALRSSLAEALHPHLDHLIGLPLPPCSEGEREAALADRLRHLEKHRLQRLKARDELFLADVLAGRSASEVSRAALTMWRSGEAHGEEIAEETRYVAEHLLRDEETGRALGKAVNPPKPEQK
ncbi:MAG: DNA primase [Chloroflexi bacterium]|nr:DNA primase [Chloroflexota bacterium]